MSPRISLLSFFLALLVLPFPALGSNGSAGSESRDGVVKVEAGGRTGTGFILDIYPGEAFIMTATHVIENSSDVQVSLFRDPYRRLPATVIAKQEGLAESEGLSILRIELADSRGLISLPLSQEVQLEPSSEIMALGFYGAGTIPWSTTKGTILSTERGSIHFTGDIEEGNSGGPLLQDAQVIGVVTLKGGEYHSATPARLAEHFAESVLGVLPVQCNARLIPEKPCSDRRRIDRRICDHLKRGNELYMDGDYEGAVQEYSTAIETGPGEAVLYNNRGAVRLTQREFEEAQKDFTEALRRDPDYAVAEVNRYLGKTYDVFFDWADSYADGEEPPNFVLDRLREWNSSPSTRRAGTPKLEGPFGGILEGTAFLFDMYHEYLRFEGLLKDVHKGIAYCYGGDIVAGNQETNYELAQRLADYLRLFQRR